MTFSARSLAECKRSSIWRWSSSGVAPRGRVPLIGRVSTCAVLDAQEALRRGAGDGEIAQVEVAGERGGVALAQPAVQLQRVNVGGMQQALGEVDLEAVAGVDVFDGAAHGFEIAQDRSKLLETPWKADEADSEGRERPPRPSALREGTAVRAALKALFTDLDSFNGAAVAVAPGLRCGKPRRDDPRPPLPVIEGDDPIVEPQRQVRRLELVAPRTGQPFDVSGRGRSRTAPPPHPGTAASHGSFPRATASDES